MPFGRYVGKHMLDAGARLRGPATTGASHVARRLTGAGRSANTGLARRAATRVRPSRPAVPIRGRGANTGLSARINARGRPTWNNGPGRIPRAVTPPRSIDVPRNARAGAYDFSGAAGPSGNRPLWNNGPSSAKLPRIGIKTPPPARSRSAMETKARDTAGKVIRAVRAHPYRTAGAGLGAMGVAAAVTNTGNATSRGNTRGMYGY